MSFRSGDLEKFHINEIELIKKDISDKNQQIANLNKSVEQYQKMTENLYQLIIDLEKSTSLSFISPEQKQLSTLPSSRELVNITRSALTALIKIHKDMPSRFEADFSKKATQIVDEINQKTAKIEEINSEREKVLAQVQKLERLASIQEKETESLKIICENLNPHFS